MIYSLSDEILCQAGCHFYFVERNDCGHCEAIIFRPENGLSERPAAILRKLSQAT